MAKINKTLTILTKFKICPKIYFPRLLTIFYKINAIFAAQFRDEFLFLGSKNVFLHIFFRSIRWEWAKGFSLKLIIWFFKKCWKSDRFCRSLSVYDNRRISEKWETSKSAPLIPKLRILSSFFLNFRAKYSKLATKVRMKN